MNAEYYFNFTDPFVCTAIHNGHDISADLLPAMAIDENVRLREEDPQTEYFTTIAQNRIICSQSRFECDLNRIREKAVYIKPEDAWGLKVRNELFNENHVDKALAYYDTFYRRVEMLFREMVQTHNKFFVYDIHSYNHHREGPKASFDDPQKNPEIIIGTSNMPESWLPLIDKVRSQLLNFDFNGRKLDVRVNVKFPGGNFSRWIHRTFPEHACSIAIEFKKIFMDEWTGEFFPEVMELLKNALASTKPVILEFFSQQSEK